MNLCGKICRINGIGLVVLLATKCDWDSCTKYDNFFPDIALPNKKRPSV